MNEKAKKILEYHKIIQLLQAEAGSTMTKNRIAELEPYTDPRDVRDGIDETHEAVQLAQAKGALPIGNFYDIAGLLQLAAKGGQLSMAELLRVRYNLATARNVQVFLKEEGEHLPMLRALVDMLAIFRPLEEEIDRCILSEDEMSDKASPELFQIRRQMAAKNEQLRHKIDGMVNSALYKPYLQDAIVTLRDGRYVIPVKAEHRSMVPGIVHDQSASGATLFIEPQSVVNLNNDLRQLESQEKAEIARVLQALSERCGEHRKQIINNQELLIHLDFINAKGRLAGKMNAEKPLLSGVDRALLGSPSKEGESDAQVFIDHPVLMLRKARHPLIDPKKVVPIDVMIGGPAGINQYGEMTETVNPFSLQEEEKQDATPVQALVITGPNTGGKTVTLKTCGLLAMMVQTGLFVPAAAGSRFPIYEDIFADIGDEQSIEQSLSTFSSHMTNIVDICSKAGEKALVLVDELGAGTDPTEGAALAIAILEPLFDQGAQVLATTHYNELKKYALTRQGVLNASMQFDVDTLSPTYKLLVGIPGKSNAFEISRKLGLKNTIIQQAQQLMESGDIAFEEVITAIESDRQKVQEAREKADRDSTEAERLRLEMAEERRKLDQEKDRILNEARAQARNIVAEAEDFSQDIREELKQIAHMESMGERTSKFDNSRRRIKDAAGRYKDTHTKEINDNPVKIEDLRVGDWVKVVSMQQNGEVMSLPDAKGEAQIKIGIMKVRVKTSDLKILPDGRSKKQRVTDMGNGGKKNKSGRNQSGWRSGLENAGQGGAGYGQGTGGAGGKKSGASFKAAKKNVALSVDVRGQRLEEAVDHAAKYIDDAFLAGLREVTIIHGRGEGILAKGIREDLSYNRNVKGWRRGSFNEGGDGVTVVELK